MHEALGSISRKERSWELKKERISKMSKTTHILNLTKRFFSHSCSQQGVGFRDPKLTPHILPILIFCLFLEVLEFELRASHLLGRGSNT
jgi:hypothetical protein